MIRVFSVCASICLVGLSGCNEGFEKEVAPVTGTVTCAGSPVTEGYVIFTPVVSAESNPMNSGKAATGTINSDGTYTLTTYDEGDGAMIGTHEVRIYKPDPEDDEQIVVDPFVCGDRVLKVTVDDKSNVIDLDPAKG